MARRSRSASRGKQVTIQHDHSISDPARDVPHLAPEEARSLQSIIERLVHAYRPQQIYLFGSRARSDSGPNSDFDLLVVVPDSASPEQTGSQLAYKVLRGTGTAADVLVWTGSAFQSRLSLAASLPATVVREGLLLYAA